MTENNTSLYKLPPRGCIHKCYMMKLYYGEEGAAGLLPSYHSGAKLRRFATSFYFTLMITVQLVKTHRGEHQGNSWTEG